MSINRRIKDESDTVFNKVIFIGHSRGGEAVNLAAKFNDLSTYPDNGNVKFNSAHNSFIFSGLSSG